VTRRRDTTALAAGSAANGLLAYVVFALTTRGLGAEAAAPVSVLWSYWALAGAALTFPVQHWITRTMTAHGDGAVRRALPRVAAAALVVSLGAGILAAVGRNALFGRDDLWFPFLVVLVTAGSALTGLTRGVLAGRRRFAAVGLFLALENAVRSAVAAVLLLAGVDSAVLYGCALVAGNLAAFVWSSSFRLGATTTGTPVTSTARFLAGVGMGQLLHQVILTGGPIALSLMQGARGEVTALFAALSLYRAPFTLGLGIVPQLTARVTAMVVERRHDAVRRLVRTVALTTAAGAVVAGVGGALVGPAIIELVFGGGVRIDAAPSGWLAAGSVLAVGNLVLMVVALAEERPVHVARIWAAAGVVALLVLLAGIGLAPLSRTVAAFVVAEVFAFVALVVAALRRGA
jgi:O-antigen/teichoic acid export membrane protein